MEILRTIALYAEAKDLPFIIIGGHALNEHGLSRQTGDLDLIVQRSKKNSWLELFTKLKYQDYQNNEFFARFQTSEIAAWPIDLMFVDDSTFDKMYSKATKDHFGLEYIRVVSIEHLITLKIHALKEYIEDRHSKDFQDLLFLIKKKENPYTLEEIESLCNQYAKAELFIEIKKALE